MKRIKTVRFGVIAFLLISGLVFTWRVWAQSEASSGKSNTIYLPWIGGHTQTQSVDASTIASDTVSLLKPDGDDGPFPEVPLPDTFETLTPGQPYVERPRPSQAELEAMAEIHTSPDTPYLVSISVGWHGLDSRISAEQSEAVIVAKVKTVHPARWNTPDGTRPANPFDPNHPGYIFTEVDIEVQEVWKGNVQPGEILTFFRNGGQVGEDQLLVLDYYIGEVVEDDTVLFYASPATVDVPGNYWRLNEQYTIDEVNNAAINPHETRSLDELRAEVVGIK